MTLNIHYKNIQDATKETIRPLIEQKITEALKAFGDLTSDDQAIAQINVEFHDKNETFEIRAHIKVSALGREYNLAAQSEDKELMAAIDQMKNSLQAQARKEK